MRESIERHRSAAQRAVACLSPAVVGVQRYSRPDHLMFLLNNREPTPIGRGLLFDAYFVMDMRAREGDRDRGFDSSIVGYGYTILHTPDTEVIAYHWHPDSTAGSVEPHVHFGPASARSDSAVRPGQLHKVHFPTGHVTLQDVIRLAITEFGVEPRRLDWKAILQ